jgi:hypothetical protein
VVSSLSGSTAPWVEWRGAAVPVHGPVAIFVDKPGGPLDRIAADPDVTTFLNDRFHPIFLTESVHQGAGTVRFYDGCGCPLTSAEAPSDPATFIGIANTVIVRPEARACDGRVFDYACKHSAPN